jgi:N-acetylglucosaminyldiphosphoundecaprenol N-acetyl-beta-D-mannosaminyltransferase
MPTPSDGVHVSAPPRFDVLGVPVSAISMSDALRTIDRLIQDQSPHYVCVTGVHGVMECRRDESLRLIHARTGLVTPDGMPLVWLAHLGGRSYVERVYGPDLMLACCERSLQTSARHFFFGGAPGIAERLAARLSERFPGLAVAGTYCPPFRSLSGEEDRRLIEEINATNADIV